MKCSVEIDVVTDRGATVRGVCKIKSEKFSVRAARGWSETFEHFVLGSGETCQCDKRTRNALSARVCESQSFGECCVQNGA